MTERVLSKQGDILDAMVWRHYGHQSGTVEQVLDSNYGLAAQGVIYPAGVAIEFPDMAEPSVPVRDWTRLW
jgi:phage tail protein X